MQKKRTASKKDLSVREREREREAGRGDRGLFCVRFGIADRGSSATSGHTNRHGGYGEDGGSSSKGGWTVV